MADLQAGVEELWERRAQLAPRGGGAIAGGRGAGGPPPPGEGRAAEGGGAGPAGGPVGSRGRVPQGAGVGRGSVLGEASLLTPGIPVIDAQTGEEIGRGVVPPGSLCIQASRRRQFAGGEFGLPCLLVIRRIEPGER